MTASDSGRPRHGRSNSRTDHPGPSSGEAAEPSTTEDDGRTDGADEPKPKPPAGYEPV